jgi:hypothetical protein
MMSLMSFHAIAAARGDGLRPEFLALVGVGTAPYSKLTTGSDGMIQSGPDPASGAVADKSTNVSLLPARFTPNK